MSKIIQDRIKLQGSGWIFSAMDFADIDNRNSIDQTLFRLHKQGIIRKLATGLYDIPIVHPKFGVIPPDPDKVATALARKFGYAVQVNPAIAAHTLGLTQQIPTQAVYLTDGLSKTIKIGNFPLTFIRVSRKKLLGIGTKAGLVIQALFYFGKDKMSDLSLIKRIQSLLADNDRALLLSLMPQAPLWMQPSLKRIIQNA